MCQHVQIVYMKGILFKCQRSYFLHGTWKCQKYRKQSSLISIPHKKRLSVDEHLALTRSLKSQSGFTLSKFESCSSCVSDPNTHDEKKEEIKELANIFYVNLQNCFVRKRPNRL